MDLTRRLSYEKAYSSYIDLFLETNYDGRTVTITEHYYIVYVNSVEQDFDRNASDMTYTYYTFTMPSNDVLIEIKDVSVDIPESPQG